MILLVCGGRDFKNYKALSNAIKNFSITPNMIIQGGANGADNLAKKYAFENNIHCAEVPALWHKRGPNAGPQRNEAMLLLRPDYCLAMPGGRGTNNMVNQCKSKNIPVIQLHN